MKGEIFIRTITIFATVLTAVFVGLKLAAMISWSWWLVWLPLLLYIGIPVVALIFLALFWSIKVIGVMVKIFWHSFGEGYKEGANEHADSKHED